MYIYTLMYILYTSEVLCVKLLLEFGAVKKLDGEKKRKS